jgi:hypothetical protein
MWHSTHCLRRIGGVVIEAWWRICKIGTRNLFVSGAHGKVTIRGCQAMLGDRRPTTCIHGESSSHNLHRDVRYISKSVLIRRFRNVLTLLEPFMIWWVPIVQSFERFVFYWCFMVRVMQFTREPEVKVASTSYGDCILDESMLVIWDLWGLHTLEVCFKIE